MPDEFDQASELEQMHLNRALAEQRAKPLTSGLKPVGYCQSPICELPFDEEHHLYDPNNPDFKNKLFCDDTCARDYARER
jgi:hypothetical protein